MATVQRPSAVARIEPAAPATPIVQAKEIAALTTAQARALLEPRLRAGVTFEQVLSEVYFAIKKDPKLEECTAESLLEATAKAIGTGLTIGEKIYLVPFNVKVKDKDGTERWESRAQAIRDFKGDAELIIRAGAARFIDAFNVYEHEPFKHTQGSNPHIDHTPLSPAKRGKLIGAYAVAIVAANLPPKIKMMYNDEIDAIRLKNSKQWKNGSLESLPSHFYGPKTCVHQITKLLPTTPGLEKIRPGLEEEVVTDAEISAAGALGSGDEDAGSPTTGSPPADADGVSMDIVDAANDHKLPGGPKAWNGQGGKAIGTLQSPHLVKIREWCIGKLGEAGTELDDATADPIKVDLGGRDRRRARASVGQVNMPPPGKIEDALRKPKAAPAPAATGPTFSQLVQQILALLQSADRTKEEKAEICAQMDAAKSTEELQLLVTDLSFPV